MLPSLNCIRCGIVAEIIAYDSVVSDVYTKLRYLPYVMDVAKPTAHCLNVVFDLFSPVIMKHNDTLSSLENRMLVLLFDRIEELIASDFENYKSLDESSPSGLSDMTTKSGCISPAIKPTLKLYSLLHNIESPEAQRRLYEYFQILDLSYLSTALYSSMLCNRMRAFLVACPLIILSPPVTDLIIITCDF
ncbi:hypothetical protein Tco_0152380 [Tanacetum coccineum]